MGGGSQKSTTTLPEKTANDLELEQLNLQVARQQSLAMQQEQAFANPSQTLAMFNAPRPVNPAYTQQQAARAAWQPSLVTTPTPVNWDPRQRGVPGPFGAQPPSLLQP